MSKNKGKPVDHRAIPTIRKPKSNDAAKVVVTRSTTTAMKGSPQWQGASALQGAVGTWNTEADSIEATAKAIRDLRAQLSVLVASLAGHRRDWSAALKQVLAQAEHLAQGSADQLSALGLDVVSHGGVASGAVAAPSGLLSAMGKAAGEATFTWTRAVKGQGFIVQYATDIANQATYSNPPMWSKTLSTVLMPPGAITVNPPGTLK